MKAYLMTLILLTACTWLVACGGSSLSDDGGQDDDDNGGEVDDSDDPTPIEDGVDYTQLADMSGNTGWDCTIAAGAISDPDNAGEFLVHESSITQDDIEGTITVSGNAVPDHSVGTFPNSGNPSSIGAVNSEYTFDLIEDGSVEPQTIVENSGRTVGVSLQSVKMEPETGETYNDNSEWRYEALTISAVAQTELEGSIGWLGTDCNNAHVQPTGEYHYHGVPEMLVANLLAAAGASTADPDMVQVGYALDGYPMYARYGYTDPNDPDSGVIIVEGSYELIEGTRPSGPGGTYDGTFTNDWEFVEGSGGLDECNGRYGVTPEYPNGVYHYFLSDDYPFQPRCLWGESNYP